MSNEKKERGGCLTAYLVVMIILQLFGVVVVFFYDKIPGVPPMDKTTLIISVVLGVLALIGLIGTWLLKAWGVYAYAIANVASIIVTAMDKFNAITLAFSIAFLALFIYLTKDIWKTRVDEE